MNEKGDITMDPAKILKGDGKYCEQLYIKIENLGEIGKFAEKFNCISMWK